MKLPLPWHANAAVCALACIKLMAVRQSGLRRDRDVRGLQSLRTFDHIELHLRAFRFKHDFEPMGKASEGILALEPVTFHYKSDSANIRQFGLIAEEVEKVDPDLVVRDGNGEIYTVRYDAVNAMLLNELLKEHREVQELTKDFQATVAHLTSRLDEQAAHIQKVSAQLATASPSHGGLEANKPDPQVVNNP